MKITIDLVDIKRILEGQGINPLESFEGWSSSLLEALEDATSLESTLIEMFEE